MSPRTLILPTLALALATLAAAQTTTSAPALRPITYRQDTIDLGLKEVLVSVPLTHRDMIKSMDSHLPPAALFPEVTLTPATDRVRLRGPPIRVSAVAEVLYCLDRLNVEVPTRRVELKHTQPLAVARLLNDLFSPTDETERSYGGDVFATPADDGKTLLVSATRRLDLAFALITALDVPNPTANPDQKAPVHADKMPFADLLDTLTTNYGTIVLQTNRSVSKVTIDAPPLNEQDAIALLRKCAFQLGYEILAAPSPGKDKRTVVIVSADLGGRSHIPIHLGIDPATIPESGNLLTQVIPLAHAQAAAVLEQIRQQHDLSATDGCTALPESNSLLITDSARGVLVFAAKVAEFDK